jgi:hypothetical protein
MVIEISGVCYEVELSEDDRQSGWRLPQELKKLYLYHPKSNYGLKQRWS